MPARAASLKVESRGERDTGTLHYDRTRAKRVASAPASQEPLMKVRAYVVLLLDRVCRVRRIEVVRSNTDRDACRKAQGLARRIGNWGYEVWTRGRQVFARYGCNNPPARRGRA